MGVSVPGQRVVVDAWSRLICAGWLPQDRVFGGNGAAGLSSGVAESSIRISLWDLTAHSLGAGRSARCRSGSLTPTVSIGCPYSGITANDQHQPASSRATATLANTGRFLRSA